MPFLYGDLGGAIVVGHSTQINGCCVKMVMVILMLIIDLRVRKAVEAQWRRRRNYFVPDIIFGQVCIIINILLLARRIFAPSVKSMSYNAHETIARELVCVASAVMSQNNKQHCGSNVDTYTKRYQTLLDNADRDEGSDVLIKTEGIYLYINKVEEQGLYCGERVIPQTSARVMAVCSCGSGRTYMQHYVMLYSVAIDSNSFPMATRTDGSFRSGLRRSHGFVHAANLSTQTSVLRIEHVQLMYAGAAL